MQQNSAPNQWLRYTGIAVLLLCTVLALTPWLDQRADAALGTALVSTLTLYASVRGVDAVVSSLAGTELLLSPAGVGVTFAPGELLDPINDLVEQLADVLLWVLTLMGIERLGLGLLGSIWVRAFCTAILGGAALVLWLRPEWHWPRGLRKLVILLALLRIALPLTAIASELIAQHVVDARASTAGAALVTMSQQIEAEQGSASAEATTSQNDESLLQRIENATRSMAESLAIEARMARLSQRLEAGVNHTIDLLALVTLRALLFPALFLFAAWLMLKLADD
jgi:hypothetical protein